MTENKLDREQTPKNKKQALTQKILHQLKSLIESDRKTKERAQIEIQISAEICRQPRHIDCAGAAAKCYRRQRDAG